MPSHELSGISTGKTSSQTSSQTSSTTGSGPVPGTRQRVYRRKITVSYLPMATKANQTGTVPLRCVVRWHGQEILFQPGELVTLTERKGGRLVKLWDNKAHALPGHPMAFELNARLAKRAKDIADHFYRLWDAAPFELVSRGALLALLYPATDRPAHLRPAETRTFRELLLEWKQLNRHLAEDSLRKYDQLATEMERWAPELRPAAMTEKLARDYLHHLLDRQVSDATIKVHFTALRKCYERLGKATTDPWLHYSAKNAQQLDLEQPELLRLLRFRPETPAQRIERDRWVFQLLSGRRYEDLEKFDPRQRLTLTLADGRQVPALRHAQGKTGNDAVVPLPPLAVLLGEAYNWQFPPASHIARNNLIKEVARAAGLNREYDDRLITGGNVISNWRPVWQVISTHTARHTGGTLVKQVSRQKELAKLLLGHADEDVTDRYAKDKAQHLGGDLLAAWAIILEEFYDRLPNS